MSSIYKEVVHPISKWKDYYQDHLQMERFDNWLNKSLEKDFYINKPNRREYICLLSEVSDGLILDEKLVKGIFSLKLPFNANDLVSLIKRTDVLQNILPDDIEKDVKNEESENFFTILKLYAAFLDFRPLNPSEKNTYNTYDVLNILPKSVIKQNTAFFIITQGLLLLLILATLVLSWIYLEKLNTKILISVMSAIAMFFNVFYLVPSYYIVGIKNAIENKDFIRVTAKITDIIWQKAKITGVKRIPLIEYTSPNNTTIEKFYLHTFSTSPPKAGGERYIPITFINQYNLVVDAPFSLEYIKENADNFIDTKNFKY